MYRAALLETIWSGQLSPTRGQDAIRLKRFITALLPVECVLLSNDNRDANRILIRTDRSMIAPDLPFGDVLAEELDVDVPQDALVVVLPAARMAAAVGASALSALAGEVVATAIVEMIDPCSSATDLGEARIQAFWHFYRTFLEAHPFGLEDFDGAAFAQGFLTGLEGCRGLTETARRLREDPETPVQQLRGYILALRAIVFSGRKLGVELFSVLTLASCSPQSVLPMAELYEMRS